MKNGHRGDLDVSDKSVRPGTVRAAAYATRWNVTAIFHWGQTNKVHLLIVFLSNQSLNDKKIIVPVTHLLFHWSQCSIGRDIKQGNVKKNPDHSSFFCFLLTTAGHGSEVCLLGISQSQPPNNQFLFQDIKYCFSASVVWHRCSVTSTFTQGDGGGMTYSTVTQAFFKHCGPSKWSFVPAGAVSPIAGDNRK